MKTSVKILFFLLVFGVVYSFAAAQDIVRETHTYGVWDYVTNESGITLTAWAGAGKEIEIPDSIYGIPVTMLAESLFRNNSVVEKVYIPDSVTTIGQYAFQGCTSLRDVHLSKRLTHIEPYTFRYCTSLESIEFPADLSNIQYNSFQGCMQLREVVIPDAVTLLGDSAFADCSSLEDVTISKNLTYIGANCFRDTPWLAKQNEEEFVLIGNVILYRWNGTDSIVEVPYGVTFIADAFTDNIDVETVMLPATVRRIGTDAFRNTVNLKTIEIPDTVTRIDNYVFRDCRSLRQIDLPNSIEILGRGVFQGCEKLTNFEIPTKVTTIGTYFLADCEKLSSVVIPSAVTSIDTTAFSGSPLVQLRVTYDSEGERFAQENLLPYTYYLQRTKDFIYSRNEDGIQILKYIGNLFEVEIPAEIDGLPVKRINTAAFQNSPIPRKIIIPDSVLTIGDWAFSYMDSLTEIKLSNALTDLGADAFNGSKLLKSVSLPGSLENIGVEPFEGLEDVVICAESNSGTSEILKSMGYIVQDPGVCAGKITPAASQPARIKEESDSTGRSEKSESVPASAPESVSADESAVLPASQNDSVEVSNVKETVIPAATEVPTQTNTYVPTATVTNTMVPTSTMTPVETHTPTVTMTPVETFTPTMAVTQTETNVPLPRYFVYVPRDVEILTPEYLDNTAYVLTVIVPSTVKEIDERIINGHQLTIVSSPGSVAEEFARKWGLKFLIEDWFDPSQIPMEGAK